MFNYNHSDLRLGLELESELECSICLESIDSDSGNLFITACNHHFHNFCIKKWYNEKNKSCPICRQSFVTNTKKNNLNLSGFDLSGFDLGGFDLNFDFDTLNNIDNIYYNANINNYNANIDNCNANIDNINTIILIIVASIFFIII
tara:strand:+ start:308 stop:745 length:438 start_codon:yes stop_codon:yes gene_type:complete